MHIVILGPYPPPHGGVQTHIVALREYLLSRGDSCSVINITRHRIAMDPGVHHPTSALGLLAVLRSLRPDVVHLHVGGTLPRRVLALALACTLLAPRSVFTFHSGGYPSSPEGRSAAPEYPARVDPAAIRSRDRRRKPGTRHNVRRYGVHPERCPSSNPISGCAPGTPAGGRADSDRRTSCEITHRSCCRWDCWSRSTTLPAQVRALEALRRTNPGAGLLLIGAGSLEAELRALIAASPAREHILLAGDVPHRRTLQAIAFCSALLRTTLYDGDAISVREALALGTPVIATDNGMRPAGVHLVPLGSEAR